MRDKLAKFRALIITDIFDKNLRFEENQSTLGFQAIFNPKNLNRDMFDGNRRNSSRYHFLKDNFF